MVLVALISVLAVAAAACSNKSGDEDAESTPAATAAASETALAAQRAAGTTHGTMQFDGRERTFRLFIPFGLKDGAKTPLVVALHGGLGSGDQFAAASRFERLAQDEGFVVVFPDGVSNTWNGGGCCGVAARQKVDDVGFLAALIDLLVREAPVDSSEVLMTGHSNGGIMSFRFGCERPEKVKAIAPVAGSLETPSCAAPHGTNLLAIHGDADQNHPIDGGEGPRSIAGVPFVSMEKTLDLWTDAMACGGGKTTATKGALTTTDWTGCKDGTIARYVIVAGADHPWPGGPSGFQGSVASQEIDASKAVWEFFESLD